MGNYSKSLALLLKLWLRPVEAYARAAAAACASVANRHNNNNKYLSYPGLTVRVQTDRRTRRVRMPRGGPAGCPEGVRGSVESRIREPATAIPDHGRRVALRPSPHNSFAVAAAAAQQQQQQRAAAMTVAVCHHVSLLLVVVPDTDTGLVHHSQPAPPIVYSVYY